MNTNNRGKIEVIIGVIIAVIVAGGLLYSSLSEKKIRDQRRLEKKIMKKAILKEEAKKKAEKENPPVSQPEVEETAVSEQLPAPSSVTPAAGFTGTTKKVSSSGTAKVKTEKIIIDTKAEAEGWKLLFQDNFTDKASEKNWQFIGGEWTVENGELVGKGPQAHIAVLRKEIPGDVRIEFTVHIDSRFLNDVSCFLNSEKIEDPAIHTYNSGYLLQYGGHTNTRYIISRTGSEIVEVFSDPIKRYEVYHMVGERKGGVVRYLINGKQIAKAVQKDPLTGPKYCKLGLYAWGGDNYYDYVKVFVPK